MAHYRWTLTLILICSPILATVITAFRIRDLPKSHDSLKPDTKKTCENCDVKVGQKVFSVKIESDKPKYEDLKKITKEKPPESKSTHKYGVISDEDEDDEDDLELSKMQTGFKQEYPKEVKLSKNEQNFKPKIDLKFKSVTSVNKIDDNDVDDSNDDGNDFKSKVKVKPKILSEIKKDPSEKVKIDGLNLQSKASVKKQKIVSNEVNDDDDDDDDDNNDKKKNIVIKQPEKPKTKTLMETKIEIKSSQTKVSNVKMKNLDSSEEADENDDDDYEGLDNIDELFEILHMKPSTKPKSTISTDTDKKIKPSIEIKSQTSIDSKKQDEDDSDDDDDHDDDDYDDDDDGEDKLKKQSSSTLKKVVPTVSHPSPVDKKDKNEINLNKPITKTETSKIEKNKVQLLSKTLPDQSSEFKKTPSPKEEKQHSKKKEEGDSKPSHESKIVEAPAKREDKSKDKKITNEQGAQKPVKEKDVNKKTKTENKKEGKDTKTDEAKIKADSEKKTKGFEKETIKPKPQEKNESSSQETEKIDNKPISKSKKDQTDHKDIFKAPEQKKDIKYDFEKPNAYKNSHKTFDYSEFEKMQVFKTHHKEKKKDKASVSSESSTDSREERYLKHVTDALNRRNLLKSEFEDFYAFFPTFAPNFSRIHNPECRRHGQILLRQLRGTKLWALNMLDATAKIPSGVLQGNGIQLGDFDQCLGSRARVQLDTGSVVKVQGKYCLAKIDIKAEHAELEPAVYLAQAKSLIRSRIDDPGHFVPRFSTLSWGVCVPAACDREDVEVIIKDALKHYQHKSGVVVKVKVDEDDCHTDEENTWEEWLELPTVLTLAFYGVVILLVLVATIQDFVARRPSEDDQNETGGQQESEKKNEKESKKQTDGILSSFSLYRTISKLLAPGSSDEISCIHGIRAIATIALLIAHKFMPIAVMPYTNRIKITEMASSPLWSWCRAGWVFTDCFLLLSGTLTAHRVASDRDTGAFRRLLSRYLRLTPALLAVVLFYAFIWDKLSTGPMWGTFVTKNAEVCQQGWWWNLLYVQNYFGLEDMCAPQTHQLALDMQLTILGGVLVWALQSGIGFAKLILPGLHLLSAYFRYTTVRDHRLTLLAYHGVSVSQLYRTARLSYTSTLHRCSPYLIGLSLGLALQKPSRHGKVLLTLGWLTSITLSGLVVWSGFDAGSTQYRYNAIFAAQYATIAPLASAMAIAWVIYAVQSETINFLSRMLCWRPLVFISRLSYALYLCQFIIFITNIGTVRTSKEFTLMSLIDLQEISAILLSSVILTLTFVIPMQSLHKIFSFIWKSDSEKSPDNVMEDLKQKIEESKIEEKKETPLSTRSRHNLVAHREVLEEIPEVEVEYEAQRESTDGLDEIVEEEEGTIDEDDQIDDLEIIEEEEAGEEEVWMEREREQAGSRGDQDLDEWEWTANGSGRSGAQYYRYAR